MAFSAGTAFVAVAPSFRGFNTKVAAHMKTVGPVGVVVRPEGMQTAAAQIGTVARDRTANVKVKVERRGLAQSARDITAVTGSVFNMTSALAAVGPALVPAGAAIGGFALGALGPLSAAAAGAGALGAAVVGNIARVNEATGKLSAPARAFKGALDGAKQAWNGFLDATQGPALGVASQGLRLFSNTIEKFAPLANIATGAVSDLLGEFGQWMKGPEAKGFLDFFEKQAGGAIRTFGHIVGNIARGMGGLMRAFAPLGNAMLRGLENLTGRFADFGMQANKDSGVKGFIAYVRQVGPKVVDFFGNLVRAFGNILPLLAPVGELALDMANGIAKFIAEAKPSTLALIAAGIGAIGIAITIATGGLNLIVPALVALGASLVYAYNHSSRFRDIVNRVAGAVSRFWKQVVVPAFKAISTAVQTAWTGYIRPALSALWRFIRTQVWPVIVKLWREVVKPIFRDIGNAIRHFWIHYAKPALGGLVKFIRTVLWPVIKWLWKNVIKPYFLAMGKYILFVWNKVIKPAFKALDWYLRKVLFPVVRFLWRNVVKPVFGWIGDRIQGVWRKVIRPTFEALKKGVDLVERGFRRGVRAIGRIWDGLKKAAGVPVNFIIGTVYNNGIRKALNLIPGVSLGKADKIKFASGGVLPGYTPGRDVHDFYSRTGGRLALSGGEAIMRPEWTRAVGGAAAVKRMNAEARYGRYAGGGVWHPGSRSQHTSGYPWARWSGDINSAGGTGTPVRAYRDGFVAAVRSLTTSYGKHIRINHPSTGENTLYAHLSRILVRAGQRVDAGQVIGREGSTGNSSGPHLHFEIAGGSAPISGGLVGQGTPSWVGAWKDKLAAAWENVQKLPGKFGAWGSLFKSGMGELWGNIKGWAADKAKNALHSLLPTSGQLAGSAVLGRGPVKRQVRQIAQAFGWGSGSQWNAILRLVAKESSWNPSAANPTSSARGLFQKMTSIHGPVESTAAGQAVWGLNYIKGRYGTPGNALGFHNRNNYYRDGGVYDTGGWLGPGQVAVNMSRKPEAIFTQDQLGRLSASIRADERGASGGRGDIYLTTPVNATPGDYAEAMLYALHRRDRGGVHVGTGG